MEHAWAWGYNDNGGLGLNDTSKYSSPVQIPGVLIGLEILQVSQLHSMHLEVDNPFPYINT